MGKDVNLESALRQALPGGPRQLPSQNGAAAVALAVHCLLVSEGFVQLHGPKGRFQPPTGWQHNPTEWGFTYHRHGFANPIDLTVAFRPQRDEVFVHLLERQTNFARYLGLYCAKYVPEEERLKGSSWQGIIQNTDVISDYLSQYICSEFEAAAVEGVSCPEAAQPPAQNR
eukprot:jgi/Astpho2/5088/Aster-08024